ncbi:MAG: lysine 5,6-aminomutase subunit alpha [Candidatus Lokiarchaeota archaeon]
MEKKKSQNESKLNLDFSIVKKARQCARNVAMDMQKFIDLHTTTTIERTVCRLLGIDDVDEFDVPLPNIVVNNILKGNGLSIGAAIFIGNAMIQTGQKPQEIAERVSNDELDLTQLPMNALFEVKEVIRIEAEKNLNIIEKQRKIYEDIIQAKAAAKQGADIIAVIRSTAQSLLDYVPYGPTTEGFGGTYATQENFRLMRIALDEVSQDLNRYIRLTNYCSGLCMPEIAAMGAFERLDVMLNDALYGILFRDINMKRTIIDQYFSRLINAYADVIINTGEDNYLTTDDAYENAHTVLASQFLNEEFALLAGLNKKQMGLGHAFEMDPDLENGFLYELAQAQMAREIFPEAPLKYMPPTKFKTGNIFKGHIQDSLFNMITIMTNQRIHLLGMLTEAIHTPFMSDRALSIENAKYIFKNLNKLGKEISFKSGGIIEERANLVLNEAYQLLKKIEKIGLFETIEQGIFGGISRPKDGGKGLEGVVEKDSKYYNPFIELMHKRIEKRMR